MKFLSVKSSAWKVKVTVKAIVMDFLCGRY